MDQQPFPMASDQPPAPMASSTQVKEPKEGFWGRVNPFARKKWVNDRVEPIKGQLSELDEVNARNGRDIRTWIRGRRRGYAGPGPEPTRPTKWQ